jgi:hypothetical protein
MVDQYDDKTPVDGDPEDAQQGLPKVDPDAPPAKPNAEEPVEQEQPDKDQGDPLEGAKGGGRMNVGRTDNATQPVDSDRERANRDLSHAVATAGLTLGEYAERAAAVEQAATVDEIEAAVRGLPEESSWRGSRSPGSLDSCRARWHGAARALASEQEVVAGGRSRRGDAGPVCGPA